MTDTNLKTLTLLRSSGQFSPSEIAATAHFMTVGRWLRDDVLPPLVGVDEDDHVQDFVEFARMFPIIYDYETSDHYDEQVAVNAARPDESYKDMWGNILHDLRDHLEGCEFAFYATDDQFLVGLRDQDTADEFAEQFGIELEFEIEIGPQAEDAPATN